MSMNVPGEFKALRWEVRDFSGDYRAIEYGDPNNPRLVQLREEYALDQIVGEADTELQRFLALKRWVRGRWNHGWSRSFKTVKDALDILHEAEKGEQFCCGHYTQVFLGCATSLGWPARGVGLAVVDCEHPRDYHVGNVGHSVVEVWSNELGKWVIMDPDLNVHYEQDGLPLNALEIRDAWLSGSSSQVEMVQEEPGFVIPSGRTVEILKEIAEYRTDWSEEVVRLICQTFSRNRAMDYYARVRVGTWQWADGRCLPTFVSHFDPGASARWTSQVSDMYWSVNQVRATTKPGWDNGGAWLSLNLEHCTPWFDHFEKQVDGGGWERCAEVFDWPMHEGVNSLELRAVNVCQRPGIVSRLVIAYAKPARLGPL